MKHSWKRLISVMLAVAMVFALAVPSYAANDRASGGKRVTWEKVDAAPRGLRPIEDLEETAPFSDKDIVRVSIVLNDASTIEAGYATKGIAGNAGAIRYRDRLQAKQDAVVSEISSSVLSGEELDVVWNLTLAANIISANVEYGRIAAIEKVKGVSKVVLETRYEPAVVRRDANEPDMSVASEMVGGTLAWAAGYTGAGSRIAIIDTGLDTEHALFDGGAFEYAIEQNEKDVELMTAEDVSSAWSQLHAADFGVDAADTYVNAKVPFGVNYVDKDLDITHENDVQGEHGSHVAGIAAANSYIPDGKGGYSSALSTVMTQGEAPDAQLMIMKVFGKGGGAYDSDYMAAIEDAIILGADSVNLSLGSGNPGFATSSTYQNIMDNLANTDTVVSISAGNAYAWASNTAFGYLYGDGVSFDTNGSPGSYTNALTVASVDNDGFTGAYMTAYGENIFYTESTGYGNEPMTSIGGTYDFIYVDGPGVDDNDGTNDAFAALGESAVKGKIAICNRGASSFFAKANAAAAQGAVGVIIANNQPGTIGMNLTGYAYTVPAVSITLADGQFLKENGTKAEADGITYYTGSITIESSIGTTTYGSEYYTMSDFSSWGVPGDLSLKPEITAPGGSIYSAFGKSNDPSGNPQGGHDQYETMSGTSMAAPQIAGLAAVMAQYIRENDLAGQTGLSQRALINSLLMSTAVPLVEEESGSYYSVFKQGAGLADVNAAMNADTYLMMKDDATASAADGKIKVELGDDPDRVGEYDFTFTINNLTDEDRYYDLSADFFTQDIFMYYVVDVVDGALDYTDDTAIYQDTLTFPLDADVTWTVDGEEFVPDEDADIIDVDGDGYMTDADAEAILDYVVNEIEPAHLDVADLDEDGDVDTYDAYLLLTYISDTSVIVPADGSVEIGVHVVLNDIADYDYYKDFTGAYIEGYVYATEKPSDEGVIGTAHSIPVLGYYGSWSDPGMFDVGSYTQFLSGEEYRSPYMTAVYGANAKRLQSFTQKFPGDANTYYIGGNPVMDEEHMPERDSVRPDVSLGAQYTLIRNAAGGRFTLLDESGATLAEEELGSEYSAYYYVNGAEWRNTIATKKFASKLDALDDGTEVTLSLQMAPEYYAQGDSIDWDSVVADRALTQTVVVDGTAPVIAKVDAGEDGLTISIKENRYVAGIFVYNEEGWYKEKPLVALASDPDEAEGAGRTVELTSEDIDLTAEENQHLMVEVYDYAANVSTYKVNLIDEELEGGVTGVVVTPDTLNLVKGNTYQLKAETEPWGTGDEVYWVSYDTDIATVDEDGLVTAVSPGTTYILAEAVENEDAYDYCVVNVIEIDKNLNGIVWDENGQVLFSQFNLKDLPEYTPLHDSNMRLQLSSATYDENGTLYAATLDSEEWLSDLYVIDEQTFEATLVGGSTEIGYMDLCAAPSLGEDHLLAVYGPYVVIVNKTTGDYEGVFNLSSDTGGNYLVGIAYEEQYDHPTYGNTDWVWLLDEAGNLYQTGFLPYGGSYSRFDVSAIGQIADGVDLQYWQSLYYDGTSLYWSRFNEADNMVEIVMVNDIYNDGSVYTAGSFADSVWPVGGLYERNILPANGFNSIAPVRRGLMAKAPIAAAAVKQADHSDAVLEDEADLEVEVEQIDLSRISGNPKGGLNAVTVEDGADESETADIEAKGFVTLKITADEANNNGLYTVTYDSEMLELVSAKSTIEYNKINTEEEGTVTIGYATRDEIAADGEIATLILAQKSLCPTSEVTVTTEELNDTNPGTEATETVGEDHAWGEPEWTWSEDYSTATATFVCGNDETHVETMEATVTEETTDATCEEAGKTVYTATVEFEGETYTDTNEVEIEALGHDWGEPEWTWTKSGSTYTATATFTCGNDETHVETVEATVEKSETDSWSRYTATVELDGKTYTAKKAVSKKSSSDGSAIVTPTTPTTPAEEPAPKTPFVDVDDDDYFADAVAWAVENGITTGTTPTTFSPYETVTRAQAVTFLWRAMGEPEAENKVNPFDDVWESDYFYKAVLWGVETGVIKGVSETSFDPYGTCTNAHILTFLWRTQGRVGDTGSAIWYADALAWAQALKIAPADIVPTDECPRADVVTFLYRTLAK